MPMCADGHQSRSTDYCDVCGSALGAAPAPDPAALRLCPNCHAPTSGRFCEGCGHDSALPPPAAPSSWPGDRPEAVDPSAGPGLEPSRAHPELRGGFDPTMIAAGAPPDFGRAGAWVARIFADRELYARVQARKGPDAERVEFPDFYPERRIILRGNQFLIGKRSASQGIVPEIDLGIAPVDIGVSRAHAMILVDQRGALTVTDLGSTNGTSLDGAETPIAAQHAVALREGSRIHVGGWTTIAITAEP
ncbi:FHA domain-containing protein [Nocardia alba]|uniref:FHA domain-containing protein n=1 Tax=Nocardia alba TaxID=225051 RepID=A0A4R1FST9_9NOCA|nr:FHA domain-containing protein [Nocardia alba]TCJ95538.1 FHA domain-containing protein [Nocardia alba]